jgi:hypothetical protein
LNDSYTTVIRKTKYRHYSSFCAKNYDFFSQSHFDFLCIVENINCVKIPIIKATNFSLNTRIGIFGRPWNKNINNHHNWHGQLIDLKVERVIKVSTSGDLLVRGRLFVQIKIIIISILKTGNSPYLKRKTDYKKIDTAFC